MTDAPLVSVDGLTKHFDVENSLLDRLLNLESNPVRAVDGVDFDIHRGETMGLVGESGCGKSTVGQTILRLLEPTAGRTLFDGQNVYEMAPDELEAFRRNAQIVFQDPFASLNPRMTVGQIVREPLDIHGIGTAEERRRTATEMLEQVGLSRDQIDRYPHEFSGGQRQRICIARALVLEPEFVLLDEPVSALDVSVQAQILNLLRELQVEFGLTYLFIAHDLGVVKYICDQVAVMYLGRIVEVGPVEEIFEDPQHPYTEALLESIPRANLAERNRTVDGVAGDVPSPRNPPAGCRFHTRCREVIQPPGVDIEQESWRAIVSLMDRLRVDPDSFDEFANDGTDGSAEEPSARTVSELRDAFGIPPSTDDASADALVDGALEDVVRGEYARAVARLDDGFPTVCRVHDPELVDVGTPGHRSACFRSYDEPPSVPGDAAESSSTGD